MISTIMARQTVAWLLAVVIGLLVLGTAGSYAAQVPNGYWYPGMGPVNVRWQWGSGRSERHVDIKGHNGTWVWAFNDPGSSANGISSELLIGRTRVKPVNWFHRPNANPADATEKSVFSTTAETDIHTSVAHNGKGTWIVAFSAHVSGDDYDIYYVRSIDDGVTWSSAVRLDTRGASETFPDEKPYLLFEPHTGVFWCAWLSKQQFPQDGHDNYNTDFDIAVASSVDNTGVAWNAARWANPDFSYEWENERHVRLFLGSPAGTIHLALSTSKAAYALGSISSSDFNIVLLTKNASSNAWGNGRPLNSEQGVSITNLNIERYPSSVASDGQTVVFAYTRETTNVWRYDVVYCVSVDGGWSFSAPIAVEANAQTTGELSIATDGQGLFMLFWESKRSSYTPPGSTITYTVGNGVDADVFYSIITFDDTTAESVRHSPRQIVDTANALELSGDTNTPVVAIDSVSGELALLALSSKPNFKRGSTVWWSSGEANIVAMTWDYKNTELCLINSPTMPVYCEQNLLSRVSHAPVGAENPTTIRIAALPEPLSESVILSQGRYVRVAAAFDNVTFPVGQTLASFRLSDPTSKLIFDSSTFASLSGGSFLVHNLGESDTIMIQQGGFEGVYRCPLGFLVPLTDNELCAPCPAGEVCTDRSTGASPSTACGIGRYCPLATFDDSMFKCRVYRHYGPADPTMTSAANCDSYGEACLPGYYCPPAALTTEHVPFLNVSRTLFDETVVFPGETTVEFSVEALSTSVVPHSTMIQLFDDRTDPSFPKWLDVQGPFALPGSATGDKTTLSGVIKSKVEGVSISETISHTYKLRFRASLSSDELGAPLELTFRRTVTTVVFNPEEGITDHVSIYAEPFVRELLLFNIGCESSLNWTAAVVNCTHPESPLDWAFAQSSGGYISIGSIDPGVLSVQINLTDSATKQGGQLYQLINERLAQRNEGSGDSVLGTTGTFTASACIDVRFRLLGAGPDDSSTGSAELKKNIPIEIKLFETCPAGRFSESGTSEAGSCESCPLGTYSSERGATACRVCPENLPRTQPGAKSIEECLAAPGTFVDADGSVLRCDSLGPGVDCLEEGMRLETLRIKPGYWRSFNHSRMILKCINPAFCIGSPELRDASEGSGRRRLGDLDSDVYCAPHHTGPMCEACDLGFVRRGLSLCEPCNAKAMSRDRLRLGWTIFAGILIVVIAFVIVQWQALSSFWRKGGKVLRQMPRRLSLTGPDQRSPRSLARDLSVSDASSKNSPRPRSMKRNPVALVRTMSVRMREKTKLDKRLTLLWGIIVSIEANTTIRILLSLFQVTNGVSETFFDLLPATFHTISDTFNIVTAELFYRIDFGCIVKSNHNTSLILSMTAPVVFTGIILIIHIIFERRLRSQRRLSDVPKLRNGSFSIFLVLLFLVYPGVSNTVLSTFACRDFDGGVRYLRKDLTVSCDAPDRQLWVGLASLGVVVYVIGIPLFYTQALFRVRHFLYPKNGEEPDPANFPSVLFLTSIYKPRFYWWEVFELIRKLVQTSLVVFIVDGSLMQAIFMVTFSMIVVILLNELKPYISEDANRLAYVAQWQILIIFFLTLLYRADLSEIDRNIGYDKKLLLDICIITACFIAPTLALYQSRHSIAKFLRFLAYKIRKNLCGASNDASRGHRLTVTTRVEDDENVDVEGLGGHHHLSRDGSSADASLALSPPRGTRQSNATANRLSSSAGDKRVTIAPDAVSSSQV